jgi:cytochrome c5
VTKYDAVFLKHFAQLILGLMAFAGLLILLAHNINDTFYGYDTVDVNTPIEDLPPIQRERVAAQRAAVAARLAPVGHINAGETGRAALVAAEEARKLAMAGQVAYGGTLDGSVIYTSLCSACHQTGAGGAPLPTAAAWAPRVAQGMEMLIKHATEGFTGAAGVMPPRGGNPALSDEQVKATVTYMVDNFNK